MGKRAKLEDELDLVPIMNLVTILIPFLLMASSYVSLAVIDSTLPAIGAPPSEPQEEPEEPPLNLSVLVTNAGFTVAGADAVVAGPAEGEEAVGPTVPCLKDGCPDTASYDVAELRNLMTQIKDKYGKGAESCYPTYPQDKGGGENADYDQPTCSVILVPESNIQYEVLVLTMDATRSDPETLVDVFGVQQERDLFPYVVIAGGVQ
jgi:hypothetical protein